MNINPLCLALGLYLPLHHGETETDRESRREMLIGIVESSPLATKMSFISDSGAFLCYSGPRRRPSLNVEQPQLAHKQCEKVSRGRVWKR